MTLKNSYRSLQLSFACVALFASFFVHAEQRTPSIQSSKTQTSKLKGPPPNFIFYSIKMKDLREFNPPLSPLPLLRKTKSLHSSIVEINDQISDFNARFELAKIYARHRKSYLQAYEQFNILFTQNPDEPRLILEMSRLFLAEEKYPQALDILVKLLKEPYTSAIPVESESYSESPSVKLKKKSAENIETIVSSEDQIDEDKARLELARVLSHKEINLEESLHHYRLLLDKQPEDPVIVLETSRIYIRLKQFQKALYLLTNALREHPENSDLLVEAAHAELALFHPKQAQCYLLKALALTQNKESILLDYAKMLMMTGSFYQAEKIYRDLLQLKPDSLDLSLNLALSLSSSERYEEAEGIYRRLLFHYPDHPKVLESLAALKMLEKKFGESLQILSWLKIIKPNDPSILLLEANVLYQNADYCNAIQNFNQLLDFPKFTLKALIGLGKAYLRLCQSENSTMYFQKAFDLDPSSIEAQFYLSYSQLHQTDFIVQVIEKTVKAEELFKWANLYEENGIGEIIPFYEASLKIDPNFFPAQIGLAQALAAHYQYDQAINRYCELLEIFPNASKIMIAIARVFSWSKEYYTSFLWYDRIMELNPQDPVPVREKSRAAYWGYFIDLSMSTYQQLLTPPLDQLFIQSLTELNEKLGDNPLSDILNQLAFCRCSPFAAYESFAKALDECRQKIPSESWRYIEEILIEYYPLYRIQKSTLLEKEAKALDWKNYFLHAIPVYKSLSNISPGNLEGIYSLAQDFCNVGLCKRSRSLYNHILNISPNHNLVKMALERNLLSERSQLLSNYYYWKEKGLGQFAQSQIARHQFDEGFGWNPSCNLKVRFFQNAWIEHPLIKDKYYSAEGQTIESDYIFNGYVRGSVGATRKNYFHRFPLRYTGFINLWFNFHDYFNLGFGIEKKNEIYNFFSLKQGIQTKIPWVSVISNLTHYWTMEATYRHYDYNDKNTMTYVDFITSYTFSDDPDIFKIIVGATYRNTAHNSRLIFNDEGKLINVIHPYWTPQHYYSNKITLQYRHNYSFFNYCEAPQRYIDIKITGEEDTARNPSLQILFEWKHDFMYHFGFTLKALIHQSRLWNAEGAWVNMYYRF